MGNGNVTSFRFVRDTYEEIGNCGKRDIAPFGSIIVTHLGGIFSGNAIPADRGKSTEFFAVSISHHTRCDFRSPTATGYPSVPRK